MSSATGIIISLEDEQRDSVRTVVLAGLTAYNRERAESSDLQPLILAARDGTRVVGGLVGETAWKWLFVDLLWIPEEYRHKGLGSSLLQAAEGEAVRRGARHSYLDTFDFQARPFYEKRGYSLFGTLEDYPPGHSRFYLRKDLDAEARASPERVRAPGRP